MLIKVPRGPLSIKVPTDLSAPREADYGTQLHKKVSRTCFSSSDASMKHMGENPLTLFCFQCHFFFSGLTTYGTQQLT